MFKRFVYLFSGLLAVLLLSFCSSIPVSAVSLASGTYKATSVSLYANSTAGGWSGRFELGSSSLDRGYFYTSTAKNEYLSDICFNFSGLSLPSDNSYFSMTFNVFASAPIALPNSSNGVVLNTVAVAPYTDVQLKTPVSTSSQYRNEFSQSYFLSGYTHTTGSSVCLGGIFTSDILSSSAVQQNSVHYWISPASITFFADPEKAREDAAKEEQEAVADESKSDADSSQNQTDSATSSIFSILQGFLGALQTGFSAQGSCNLSLDFGFFDGGVQNICTGLSSFSGIVTPIITIVMIGVIIGLSIAIFHNFKSLFNEIFGGGS